MIDKFLPGKKAQPRHFAHKSKKQAVQKCTACRAPFSQLELPMPHYRHPHRRRNEMRVPSGHVSTVSNQSAPIVLALFLLASQLIGVIFGFIIVFVDKLLTKKKHNVTVTMARDGRVHMRARRHRRP